MQTTRERDTAPELALRSALHRTGLRFRVNVRLMPNARFKADIVFGPSRTVVFVDGCFWHGCPLHPRTARRNADYWKDKVERNKTRDANTDAQLKALGWLVIRVWEHESPVVAAERIRTAVVSRRAAAIFAGAEAGAAAGVGGAGAGVGARGALPPGSAARAKRATRRL